MKEYDKKCQLCGKQKESRLHYKKINGKWLKICKSCWIMEEAKNEH